MLSQVANVFLLSKGQIQLSTYSEREVKKSEMVMISFQRALSLGGRVESIRLFIKSEGPTEISVAFNDLNLCLFAQQLC